MTLWSTVWWFVAAAWAAAPNSAPRLEALEEAVAAAESTIDEALPNPKGLDHHFAGVFALAKKTRDPVLTAAIRLRMGRALHRRERSQEALFELEQGLVGLRRGTVGPRRASAAQAREVTNLGVKSFAGQRAVPSDLPWAPPRPLPAWAGQRPLLETALLLGAGNLYQAQQQLDAAATLYAEALQVAPEGHEIRELVQVSRAWLYLRRGDPAQAIEIIDEATDGRRTELRSAWLARGSALLDAGGTAPALAVLDEAATLYSTAADVAGLGIVQVERGLALEALARQDEALAAFDAAQRSAEGDVRWAAPLGRARVLIARGDLHEALAAYTAYLDALEASSGSFHTDEGRFSLLQGHAAHLQDMVHVAVRIGEPAVVHAVTARARRRSLPALYGRTRSREVLEPGVLPAAAFQDEAGDARLNEQIAVGTSVRAASAAALVTTDLGPPGTPPPSGPTTLAYTLLSDQVVITLRPTHGPAWFTTVQVSRDALRTHIRDLRAALGTAGDRLAASRGLEALQPTPGTSASTLQRTLYDHLIAPVADRLPPPDKMLVVVPDGDLWMLPFAALEAPDGALFGARVQVLSVSEGSHHALTSRPRSPGSRALVVGNPGAGSVWGCGRELGFASLPGAEDEARALAALSGWSKADLLLGTQVDALRLDAWHGAYDVVHLATHGLSCGDDPLASFVLLGHVDPRVWRGRGDGLARRDDPRLPVRRAAGIDSPSDPPRAPQLPGTLTARTVVDQWSLDADLVTLSACESGLGQASSEGVIGLSRAFLVSGARSVLVSLWTVEDRATEVLMLEFYRGYLAHRDKARALRDAMAHTRRTFPEPRQWAAFTLVGAAQ